MSGQNKFTNPIYQQNAVPLDAAAVTASDATVLSGVVGLFVGGAGNVAVVTSRGTTTTFTGVAAGSTLWIGVTKVKATGTTATNIVALKE